MKNNDRVNYEKTDDFRCGYAAIVGRPNVGKSTLMNKLLQLKLSIVTYKPQTTRHRILGILNGSGFQAIFMDTPGLMEAKTRLQESMAKTAQRAAQEADLILMMVEAGEYNAEDERICNIIKTLSIPRFLLINKIDRVGKPSLLPLIDDWQKKSIFTEIIPLSALKGEGTDKLLSLIAGNLPVGPPFYDPEMISDEPERFFAAELIREQIFLQYSKELPYSAAVHIESFQERPGRKDYIAAVISVERDSQKGIIIGKGGTSLKRLSTLARENIERFLGRPIYLEVHVQVRKQWRKDARQIKKFGY